MSYIKRRGALGDQQVAEEDMPCPAGWLSMPAQGVPGGNLCTNPSDPSAIQKNSVMANQEAAQSSGGGFFSDLFASLTSSPPPPTPKPRPSGGGGGGAASASSSDSGGTFSPGTWTEAAPARPAGSLPGLDLSSLTASFTMGSPAVMLGVAAMGAAALYLVFGKKGRRRGRRAGRLNRSTRARYARSRSRRWR